MSDNYADPDLVLTPADWRDADYVSSAVNFSGVAISLPEVVRKVRQEAEARGQSRQWADRHPLLTIYLDKLAELNGLYLTGSDAILDCYTLVTQKAGR